MDIFPCISQNEILAREMYHQMKKLGKDLAGCENPIKMRPLFEVFYRMYYILFFGTLKKTNFSK